MHELESLKNRGEYYIAPNLFVFTLARVYSGLAELIFGLGVVKMHGNSLLIEHVCLNLEQVTVWENLLYNIAVLCLLHDGHCQLK